MILEIKHIRPHVSPIKLSAMVIKTRFSNFCAAADVWSAAEQSTAVYTYAGTGSGAYLKEHSHCQQNQLRLTSTITISLYFETNPCTTVLLHRTNSFVHFLI